MTAALVRKCNKCAKPFLKEEGCNKMKCSCGNTQCFVCSDDILDYSHFDRGNPCPMYGDMAELLEKQVAAAEDVTVQKLLETRSDLKDEDIRVAKRQKKNRGGVKVAGELLNEDFDFTWGGFGPFVVGNEWPATPGLIFGTPWAGTAFDPQPEPTPPVERRRANNPYGSQGAKSCGSCRRRKGRVLLSFDIFR